MDEVSGTETRISISVSKHGLLGVSLVEEVHPGADCHWDSIELNAVDEGRGSRVDTLACSVLPHVASVGVSFKDFRVGSVAINGITESMGLGLESVSNLGAPVVLEV